LLRLASAVITATARVAGLCHSVLRGEPYSTCSVGCNYCYARWYRGPHGEPAPQPYITKLVEALGRTWRKLGAAIPLRVATLSDPFQPAETHYKMVLRLMRLALNLSVPIVLNTRLAPPGREWWETMEMLASRGLILVQITLTGLQEDWRYLRLVEGGSPPPEERLSFAGEASDRGIPVAVRLQPLIPGIGDRDPRGFVKAVAGSGGKLLITEFLRIEKKLFDTYKRLFGSLSEIYNEPWEDYTPLNLETGVLHPPLRYRIETARILSEEAKAVGIAFQTCKEGLFHLHHPGDMDCCGFKLFNVKLVIARRPHLGDVYRIASIKGKAAPDDIWSSCRAREDLLCAEKLARLPGWLRKPLRYHEKKLAKILQNPKLVETIAPSLQYDPLEGVYKPRDYRT